MPRYFMRVGKRGVDYTPIPALLPLRIIQDVLHRHYKGYSIVQGKNVKTAYDKLRKQPKPMHRKIMDY